MEELKKAWDVFTSRYSYVATAVTARLAIVALYLSLLYLFLGEGDPSYFMKALFMPEVFPLVLISFLPFYIASEFVYLRILANAHDRKPLSFGMKKFDDFIKTAVVVLLVLFIPLALFMMYSPSLLLSTPLILFVIIYLYFFGFSLVASLYKKFPETLILYEKENYVEAFSLLVAYTFLFVALANLATLLPPLLSYFLSLFVFDPLKVLVMIDIYKNYLHRK